jgi:hypothetical protein
MPANATHFAVLNGFLIEFINPVVSYFVTNTKGGLGIVGLRVWNQE